MKRQLSIIISTILFILGIPFLLVDTLWKNKLCEFVITKVTIIIGQLNWWGRK